MIKKLNLIVFAFIFIMFSSFAAALDENSFKASGWVNDFAGIIDAASAEKLTSLIGEVNQKTGAEIAVVTIKSLEGDPLEDFTNRLFNKWGIGKKGKDNGVMILVAYDERKIRIETGYGLEGIIPDGLAGSIIRGEMMPRFKQGLYGDGILAGTYAVAQNIASDSNVTLTGNYEARGSSAAAGEYRKLSPFEIFFLIVFMIIMLIIFITNPWLFFLLFLGGRRGSGGGGFGGGFGGFGGGSSGGGGASGGW
jgi:uncharacterized protein